MPDGYGVRLATIATNHVLEVKPGCSVQEGEIGEGCHRCLALEAI
jgi:hypothetical protein